MDEQLKKQREKEAEIEAKLSAPKPTGPSSQPENACKPAFRAAESRTDEIQRSETSKPAWKPGQGKWRSVAANDGSTVSPPSEPSSTQLNSARGSRVNFDSGPARPAPSAFSSLKKPDGSTDSKSKPATGPPKIGSGKWANRRQQ